MEIDKKLLQRSSNSCELCKSNENICTYEVSSRNEEIVICEICNTQLTKSVDINEMHWHCLSDSMWSEVDAVKVVAYRIFNKLNNQEMIDMMYLEDDILTWAKEEISDSSGDKLRKDANGNILNAGDTVTLIKDLDVKGAKFVAKRGTVVKNIRIGNVDNHIEAKINGTSIYLKCDFIKK